MITLIDGTRLPSHSELYKVWDKIFNNNLFKRLCVKDYYFRSLNLFRKELKISEGVDLTLIGRCHLEFLNTLSYKFKYKFEDYNRWDILIFDQIFMYCIEYKSNVNEWKKEIHNFLAQINRRSNQAYGDWSMIGIKVLMSFDSRFLDYEKILSENKIRLIILPQTMLNNPGGNQDE